MLKERLASEAKPVAAKEHGSLAQAFKDPTVYLLALAYLSILAGTQAVSLWTPTLLKHMGMTIKSIGALAALPPAVAIAAVFLVGRSSDRRQERRWHFALSMFAAAASLALLSLASHSVAATVAMMAIVSGGAWAALAVFWTIPPAYLSPKARAGGIGFISSAGAIGGLVSPIIVGWSSEMTGSLFGGLALIGLMLALSALALLVSVGGRKQ